MNRSDALRYVSYYLDDAGGVRAAAAMPAEPRLVSLVGWQCGFEPLFVAVWSYLPDVRLDDDDAEEIATDYLAEIGWFTDGPVAADYVL